MSRTLTLEATPKAAIQVQQSQAHASDIPFTLQTLKAAIPAHCFHKDTLRSIAYMLRDFAFIAACYAVYPYIHAYNGMFNPCQWNNWRLSRRSRTQPPL
jgi:fatty acid desaturase